MDYKNSGVDIEAGYKSVELMKKYVQGTMRPEVLTGLGGFSGAFSMEKFKNMEKPTLVSGTDGVGTKLKLAFLMDKHDTIGIDCVAMCVNDIAKKAISSVGLEPVSRPVRGGTDGARLSFMGLPCPNLGTGGYGFHGPFEHISVEGMKTAVAVIKEIVRITAEL